MHPAAQRPRRRLSRLVPALLLPLLLASGCGGTPAHAPAASATPTVSATASAQDQACRGRFAALAGSIGSRPRHGYAIPIAFETRWSSVESALAYYVTNAAARDCHDVLGSLRTQTRQLERLTASLAPYDVQARALDAKAAYHTWAAHHSRKQRAKVAKALHSVLAHTTQAAQDLRPALNQLALVDPKDTKKQRKARQDLDLLARNSPAYIACRKGLKALAKAGVH